MSSSETKNSGDQKIESKDDNAITKVDKPWKIGSAILGLSGLAVGIALCVFFALPVTGLFAIVGGIGAGAVCYGIGDHKYKKELSEHILKDKNEAEEREHASDKKLGAQVEPKQADKNKGRGSGISEQTKQLNNNNAKYSKNIINKSKKADISK